MVTTPSALKLESVHLSIRVGSFRGPPVQGLTNVVHTRDWSVVGDTHGRGGVSAATGRRDDGPVGIAVGVLQKTETGRQLVIENKVQT